MVKHTQIIRRQIDDELFEQFDYFATLALKGLREPWGLQILSFSKQ